MATFEDRAVGELGRRLAKIYSEAQKGMTEKVNSFFANFEKLDEKKKKLVEAGKLTEQEYKTWKKNKLLMGEKYMDLRDSIADNMLHANERAAAIINHELPNVYAHNYNQVGEGVERKVKGYSFDLTNPETVRKLATDRTTLLPYKFVDGHRDTRWNSTKVNAQILQGILQGESADQMAKRLMNISVMNQESALRNARTAVTSAQNKGRMDAMKQCEDDGVIMYKEWIATKDERTREAHEELDRVQVPYNEPFENSIGQIMYPGDPDADPANTYNCRCAVAEVVKGFKPKEETQETENEPEEQSVEPEVRKPEYSTSDLIKPERPHRSDFDDEDSYYAAREEYKAERDAYNEQFNDVIEKAMSYERFETKEDVIAWAEENGVSIDDGVLEQIDLRAFNETTATLDEMFERFPEVKSYTMEDFDGNTFQTGFNIGLDDTGLLSANGGLNFNPRLFENYETGLRDGLGGQTDGFFVRGDGTFSSLVRHEYGHNVQEYIETQMAMKYHHYVDDWRKNFATFDDYKKSEAAYFAEKKEYDSGLRSLIGLAGSSEYSNTNTLELFAEGFSEWSSGGTTEFAKAFGEFLGRWYK